MTKIEGDGMADFLSLADSTISYEVCGNGPPVLFLHGYPTNRTIWSPIVENLSTRFTCVLPDLRGYGQSIVHGIDEISNFAKSEMAKDQVSLMEYLGFNDFSVVGHDRGARVAYRLALEYSNKVNSLVVMDIIPTYDLIQRFDWEASLGAFHWSFCAADDGWPELMISNSAKDFLNRTIKAWTGENFEWEAGMVSSFENDFSKISVIRATCQDFRCLATINFGEDQSIVASGRKIDCPTMILWGESSFGEKESSPLDIWKKWCKNVTGHKVDSGHFLQVENPNSCTRHIVQFLPQ